MQNRKYQVFISSTYSDLVEERKKVLDILLMADCIPAGMEAFVATDVEQFEVIKKVIDLCDYYILIIGQRYGSINQDTGISYTEMEYDYAIKNKIPVLVFVLDEQIVLPDDKKENEPDKVERLKAFRAKALTNRLCSIWKNTDELVGKVAVSIMTAKETIERPGWQRGTDFDEASLRRTIMKLQEENENLKVKLNDAIETEDTGYETVRTDIYINQGTVLETKCSRPSMSQKKLIEEIEADITHYGASNIFFYIYDKEKIIDNPELFKKTYENKIYEKNIYIEILQPKELI